MPWKVAGVVAVLVIWRGSVVVLPSWTEPKLREMGEMTIGDGVAAPRRLMKSSAVLESEVISRAEMRLVVVFDATGCGEKVTMMMQLAEGRRASPQLLSKVKSGVVWRAVMWMVVVPVLARVTVCELLALPTCVVGKVRELCERA